MEKLIDIALQGDQETVQVLLKEGDYENAGLWAGKLVASRTLQELRRFSSQTAQKAGVQGGPEGLRVRLFIAGLEKALRGAEQGLWEVK